MNIEGIREIIDRLVEIIKGAIADLQKFINGFTKHNGLDDGYTGINPWNPDAE